MANIRLKSIEDLSDWNTKELRKLRITIKNRLETLKLKSKPKELPATHPLVSMDQGSCSDLLRKVMRAEKNL